MQVGRRQVDAAAVGVGGVVVEAVGARADDAPEDDVLRVVVLGDRDVGRCPGVALVVLEDDEVAAIERGLVAVGEADAVGVVGVDRGGDDYADRAGGV